MAVFISSILGIALCVGCLVSIKEDEVVVIEKKFTLEEIYELFAEWCDDASVNTYLYDLKPFPLWLEEKARKEEDDEV